MSEAEVEEPADNPYVREPPTSFEPVDELGEAAAREQVDQLREAVRYHDYRYYVLADPVVSDSTYDTLFDRLDTLEEAFDLATEDSPTRQVGGEPLDELETVEHVAPMLSIDSSGDADGVREFDRRVVETLSKEADEAEAAGDAAGGSAGDRESGQDVAVEYVCEPKFDGISVEVVFEDGRYDRAVTRGDGERGDDVTENVRTVRSIPQRLRGDYPEFLALRGELYMPRDAFQALNRERVERGEDPFANPRNATAGTVRQLDPSVVARRPLDCFFFEILEANRQFESHWEVHRTLPDWGLPVNDLVELVSDVEAVIDYRDRLLAERDDLDYETDGIVAKVDDREQCDVLGSTSAAPRWAFAYKFPPRTGETTVREITVQVGRTGRLTPVALLDPVEVGGVTVSRASLHNPDQIAELGVDVGDRVRVERAGDVIPYVAEVVENRSEGHFELPEECPACGSAVQRDGPLAFCTGGLACPAQLQRAIEHYASREGLDIEGLGEKTVEELMDEGLVEGLSDLYELEAGDLVDLEGWGETSAGNLLDELAAAKTPALADFLVALGVPEVGPTTARNLARHIGTLEALMDADEDELREVDDVGPTVATEIHDFFASGQNRAVVERLREHGVEPRPAGEDEEVGAGGDELSGLTFVFTGALSGYTREEAQDLVERHGGTATSSVSGNTDYLVVGEDPGQRKREAADDHGVQTVDEREFEAMLDERGVEG